MFKCWLRGLVPCTYTERVQDFLTSSSPRLSPEPGSAGGYAGSHASVLVLQPDGEVHVRATRTEQGTTCTYTASAVVGG